MNSAELTTAIDQAIATIQQLRQSYDAALETIATLQSQPAVLPGFAVLTPAELTAIENSRAALVDAISANKIEP
jgi:hypothetical protein